MSNIPLLPNTNANVNAEITEETTTETIKETCIICLGDRINNKIVRAKDITNLNKNCSCSFYCHQLCINKSNACPVCALPFYNLINLNNPLQTQIQPHQIVIMNKPRVCYFILAFCVFFYLFCLLFR